MISTLRALGARMITWYGCASSSGVLIYGLNVLTEMIGRSKRTAHMSITSARATYCGLLFIRVV